MYYVDQADQTQMCLPLSFESWDYKHVPLHPAISVFETIHKPLGLELLSGTTCNLRFFCPCQVSLSPDPVGSFTAHCEMPIAFVWCEQSFQCPLLLPAVLPLFPPSFD